MIPQRVAYGALLCAAFAAIACDHRDTWRDAASLTHGNPDRGAIVIEHAGCGSCHTIPGIHGAVATVGPSLKGIAGQSYIAGVLVNNPENMERWLLDPPAVDSNTAMPNVGLDPHQARDVAAYLYTLK